MKLIITELYLNEICAIESFFVALFAFVSTYTPIPLQPLVIRMNYNVVMFGAT